MAQVLQQSGEYKGDLSTTPGSRAPPRGPPAAEPKWTGEHQEFVALHGLQSLVMEAREAYDRATQGILSPRQAEALWLRICLLRKQESFKWVEGCWLASVGASVRFLKIGRHLSPCIQPGMACVCAQDGHRQRTTGLQNLAFQGLQKSEVAAFNLAAESDVLLRDFAGNAFTANILAAFVLAACAHLLC